jgi:hypothetical protein
MSDEKKQFVPEWQRQMADAVGDDLVRSLVSDFRRGPSQPSSLGTTPDKKPEEPKSGSGWTAPLDVPGIKLVDQLCEHQDRLDKLEKAQQLKNTLELLAMSRRSDKMK